MKTSFWAATDVGRTRDHNEDNFLVDKKLELFIVADTLERSDSLTSDLAVRLVPSARLRLPATHPTARCAHVAMHTSPRRRR